MFASDNTTSFIKKKNNFIFLTTDAVLLSERLHKYKGLK